MRSVFAEVRRVLADEGTLWLNLGDSYSTRVVAKQSSHQRGLGFESEDLSKSWVEQRAAGRTRMPSDYGLPEKNLMGMPWRTAFALQDDGWILRNDIIWAKPNGMPESVTDRLSTKHEHVFMFSKRARYWFDLDPIREQLIRPEALLEGQTFKNLTAGRSNVTRYGRTWEECKAEGEPVRYGLSGQSAVGNGGFADDERGKNPGDVWTVPTQPFAEAHFAVMPKALAERAVQAGCKPTGTVLDPFSGSGTTGLAAAKHGRKYVGIDLNVEYLDLSLRTRLGQKSLLDGGAA